MTEEAAVDLGNGVLIEWMAWADHDRVGFIETHNRSDGEGRCSGSVLFDLPGVRDAFPNDPVWSVESLDPLTLSPSIRCRTCGHHGFVQRGRWVPA